ncbi:MAG: GGDEF domain-containing protein [Deltaproteobacteria bacterium]|nr:MAG: GGDEF domain-containing protein [Deltaproteobacteria bacterium]
MDTDSQKTVVQRDLDLPARTDESSYLVVLSGTAIGRMFKVEPGMHRMGRAAHVDIVLDDPGVSRVHARLVVGDDGAVDIEDLDSTNGTFVNDLRVRRARLRDGDKIRIGTVTILKFAHRNALEAEFQRHLYDSVTRDALTGLYNKRYFEEDLERAMAHARRHHEDLVLGLFDLDHFKRINDTHGHPTGDAVLEFVASVLAHNARSEDTVCRVGGEEFAVVMRACSLGDAEAAGERFRRAVEVATFERGDVRLSLTISVGLAAFDRNAHVERANLYEAADRALYAAKRAGRNCVRLAAD